MEEVKEKKKSSRVVKGLREIKYEFARTLTGLISSAFALIAALAWNDLVKKGIDRFFRTEEGSLKSQLVYAIIITVITVFVSYYLGKFVAEKKVENSENES